MNGWDRLAHDVMTAAQTDPCACNTLADTVAATTDTLDEGAAPMHIDTVRTDGRLSAISCAAVLEMRGWTRTADDSVPCRIALDDGAWVTVTERTIHLHHEDGSHVAITVVEDVA